VRGLRLRIDLILTGRMGRARRDDDFVMAWVRPSTHRSLLINPQARFVKNRMATIITITTTAISTMFVIVIASPLGPRANRT